MRLILLKGIFDILFLLFLSQCKLFPLKIGLFLVLAEFLKRFPVYRKVVPVVSVMAWSAEYCTVIYIIEYFVMRMAWDNVMRTQILFRAAGCAAIMPFKKLPFPLIKPPTVIGSSGKYF